MYWHKTKKQIESFVLLTRMMRVHRTMMKMKTYVH